MTGEASSGFWAVLFLAVAGCAGAAYAVLGSVEGERAEVLSEAVSLRATSIRDSGAHWVLDRLSTGELQVGDRSDPLIPLGGGFFGYVVSRGEGLEYSVQLEGWAFRDPGTWRLSRIQLAAWPALEEQSFTRVTVVSERAEWAQANLPAALTPPNPLLDTVPAPSSQMLFLRLGWGVLGLLCLAGFAGSVWKWLTPPEGKAAAPAWSAPAQSPKRVSAVTWGQRFQKAEWEQQGSGPLADQEEAVAAMDLESALAEGSPAPEKGSKWTQHLSRVMFQRKLQVHSPDEDEAEDAEDEGGYAGRRAREILSNTRQLKRAKLQELKDQDI